MLDYIRTLLTTDSLSPHGICLLWRPELIWTHAVSDGLIGAAYFSIPIVLAYFVSRRPDVGFSWVFWSFAVFILACGTTHFMSIWTLWVPDYGVEAAVKAVTATASVATAVALWPMLPGALALPSPSQLRSANQVLEERVRERDEVLARLRSETLERERAEAMLRQAQKMEAVGQLTGGIAHDFNNLLTVVIGNLEIIGRRAPSDPALERSVRNAAAAASRAATLTQQLLAFARKQPLQPIRCELDAVVSHAVDFVKSTLGERVVVKIEPGASGLFVEVDPNQLENAILNLAVNARDAMPKGGVVTFRTGVGSGDPPTVVVEVTDTGAGMSAEVLDKATEPFFTTKPLGQGSGLGLSQVHGFAAQSQGRLEIESAVGLGTSVRIRLPIASKPS